MATPYFVADSASVTVLRSLASTSFGKYNLTLPDGVDLEDVYEVSAEGNELAYVASLGARRRVGGMFRRFVRADVNVTAAGEDMVPATDVERVLNDAEKRVSGDFFLESDITRAGLGPWVPFVDFQVGDIANVEIWGRVVPLVVTRIEPKRTEHSDDDWSVHVGGQLLSDSEARLAENADIYNAVVSDRRDLAGLDGKIRTETSNRKAAVSAEREERRADVAQVREVLGGAQADERSLVSQLAAVQAQIRGMVGNGETPPPPGMLNSYLWMNTRLWQQQQEFNRLNEKFQVEVRERQWEQGVINARLSTQQASLSRIVHMANFGSWRVKAGSWASNPEYVEKATPVGCEIVRRYTDNGITAANRNVFRVFEPGLWEFVAQMMTPEMQSGTGTVWLYVDKYTNGMSERIALVLNRVESNPVTSTVFTTLRLTPGDLVHVWLEVGANTLSFTQDSQRRHMEETAKYSTVMMRQLSVER